MKSWWAVRPTNGIGYESKEIKMDKIDEIIEHLEIYTDDVCEIEDYLSEIVCVHYQRITYYDTAENHCTRNMTRANACRLIKYSGSNWTNVRIEVVE